MKKVLVVDDEFATREAIARTLVAEGFEVRKAGDIPQAVERLSEDRYDLVLCDQTLREGGGAALVERMRADARYRAIAVVLMVEPYGKAPAIDGVERLTKPVKLDELLAAVGRLLPGPR